MEDRGGGWGGGIWSLGLKVYVGMCREYVFLDLSFPGGLLGRGWNLMIRWFGRWENECVLIWVYWTVLDVVVEGDGNGILGRELWEMEGDVESGGERWRDGMVLRNVVFGWGTDGRWR